MKKHITLALLAFMVIGGVYIGSNLNTNPVSMNESFTNTILSVAPSSQTAVLEGIGSGIIAWWRLDEGSGTTAYNSSIGSVNHATLYNGPTWTTGKHDGALGFTTGKYVQSASPVLIGDAGTVSLWFKYSLNVANQLIVGNNNWTADRNGFAIAKWSTAGSFSFEISNETRRQYITTSATNASDGNWHHLTAVWEGAGPGKYIRFYVDGIQRGSAPQTLNPVSTLYKLTMGKDPANNAYYLTDGTIDDVRVYNRALTPDEIVSLAGSPPGATPLSGWSWSSTIGWVDLSKVSLTPSGELNGYGWSSNIGWIKFGGFNVSDFPSTDAAAGVAAVNATIAPNGAVSGWARACAGAVPGDCSSPVSRTDGWDGWIALAGTKFPSVAGGASGLWLNKSVSPMTLKGHAWGGVNVGWLRFDALATMVGFTATCSGLADASGNVIYSSTASGGSGSGFRFKWDSDAWTLGAIFTSNKSISYYPTNPNPVTVALQVEDVDAPGVYITPICPKVTTTVGGGTTITGGTCSLNGILASNTVIAIGESAQFSINPASFIGGVGPYTYNWYTGTGVISNALSTYSHSYSTALGSYPTKVVVTDSSSPVRSTGDIQCGNLTVTDDAETLLKLKVGDSIPNINIKVEDGMSSYNIMGGLNSDHPAQMIIKQGQAFALAWDNKYSVTNYLCSTKSSSKSDTNPFTTWADSPYGASSKSYGSANTKNAPTGDYKFSIQCKDLLSAAVVVDKEVKIKIINVAGGER